MIYPYGKRNVLLVVGGLIFYHLLVIALCLFWIYRFLILTFNPGVILLLAMFGVSTAVCDCMLHKVNGFGRFLVCYRFSREGILYMKLGKKTQQILWTEIKAFGIYGFADTHQFPVVYFSKNWGDGSVPDGGMAPLEHMIQFRLSKAIWEKHSCYFPSDVVEKLKKAVVTQRDCYIKR